MSDLDFSAAVDSFVPADVAAKRNTFAVQDSNPDEAAKGFSLAPKVGLAPSLVQNDVPGFEKKVQLDENGRLTDTNPVLAKFATDPAKAAATVDDYGRLNDVSTAMLTDTEPQSPFYKGILSGYEHQDYARLAAGYQTGLVSEDKLKPYEEEFKKEQPYSGISHYTNSFGSLLGMMLSSAKVGGVAAGIGAGGGALVGGPVGAATGGALGFLHGMTADFVISSSGQVYRGLDQATTPDGQKIPEAVKQTASATAGVLAGAIATFTGGLAKGAVSSMTSEAVSRALAQPGVLAALGRGTAGTLQAAGIGGLVNTSVALSQLGADQLAKTWSGQNFQTVFNNPEEREKFTSQIMNAFVDGALLFGTLHTIPVGVSAIKDRLVTEQTASEALQRESTLSAVQVSKTAQRAPQLLAEYINAHGAPDLKISAEAMSKLPPEMFPELREQIEREAPNGGDVAIDPGTFYTKMAAQPELFAQIKDDIRGQSGLTPREAEELRANPPDYSSLSPKEPDFTALGDIPGDRQPRVVEAVNEVETQRKAMWLDPIIDPAAAGMDQRSFERMSKHLQEVQRDVTQRAYDAAEREIKRRETPLWKNELKFEAEGARRDIESRPDVLAYTYLTDEGRDSVWKLNYKDAVDVAVAAGEKDGYTNGLPQKIFGVNGVHPDEAASFFGFNSGKELLDNLRRLDSEREGVPFAKHVDGLIANEAQRRMEEKHGTFNEKVLAEAIEHALSVKQIDVLVDELKVLGADQKVTRDAVVDSVRRDFENLRVSDAAKSADFQRLVGKYGEAAFRASNAGKNVDAFQAKMRQTINFLRAREALSFEKEVTKIEDLVDRFSKNATVAGVEQSFTDRIHQVLGAMDLPIPRSEQNLVDALGRPNLLEFISDIKSRTEFEIHDADWLHEPILPKPRDLTVSQFRELGNLLTSLKEVGQRISKVRVNDKLQAFEGAVGELLAQLDSQSKDIMYRDDTALNTLKSWGRHADAPLTKIEQLGLRIDKDNPFGPFNTYIFRPIREASNRRDDALAKWADEWKKLPTDRAWNKSLSDAIDNKQIMDDSGRPYKWTRKNLIAMALNLGNDGNAQRLARGLKVPEDEIRQFVNDRMTDKDWKVVQGIWDGFDKFWPEIEKFTKRVSGVAVEKVKATSPTPGVKGGYFPLVREPRSITVPDSGPGGLIDRPYFYDPFTSSSASKARVGGDYPLDLNLDRLPSVIRQTVHDVYMREAVSDVNKFVQDKLVRQGIDNAYGPEYTDQLTPWLKHVANDGGQQDPSGLGWWAKQSSALRSNVVTALVGFRPSTAEIHGGAAFFNSMVEAAMSNVKGEKRGIVGLGEQMKNLGSFLQEQATIMSRNPETNQRKWTDAMEQSAFLRNRAHNLDRDANAQMLKTLGQGFDRRAYQAFALSLVGHLDMASAVAVFNAKMAQGLKAGLSYEDARYASEQAVSVAHGSSGLPDLAAIQRGNEWLKWFTTFYGYFNHNYNRNREIGRQISRGEYWQAAIRSIGYLLAPALVHAAVREGFSDDENLAVWGAKAIATQAASGLPFWRDFYKGIFNPHGHRVDATPLSQAISTGSETVRNAINAVVAPDDVKSDWLSKALETPGFFLGHLPGVSSWGKIGQTASGITTVYGSGIAQFLWDRSLAEPEAFDPNWARLIQDGKYKDRKGH